MRDQRAMPPPPPRQQQPPQPPPQPQHLLQPPALPDWAAGLNIDDLVSWGAPGLGREPSLPMPAAAASASSAGGPADNDRAAIEAVLRQQREQIAELTRKNEEIVNQLVKQRKQQREGM